MLESLHIQNLVLVPELQLEFAAGFNTVTGETGAGKSLIIGALQLLAGGRASPASIRKGARQCEVAGLFRVPEHYPAVREELARRLEEYGLPPCEEGALLLRRVITESGSRAFVNGSSVTAAILKGLGDLLIDIHGPNENHSLLFPARQLKLLDLYGGHRAELQAVAAAWETLAGVRARLQALDSDGLAPEEQALFAHQLKEIDAARLAPDEEEQLLARHRLAANAATLRGTAGLLAQALAQGDDSLVEALAPWIRKAEELEELDPEHAAPFVQRLNALSEELSDLANDLDGYGSRLDIDEEALHDMEERIELIQKLRRRYGPTVEDVLATAERLRERLRRAASRADDLKRLHEEERAALDALAKCCAALTARRQDAAARLAPAIAAKLRRLGFARALFEARLDGAPPGPGGADACEFYFAANPGEEPRPLRQTASSGEIARVMLAIKTVLSEVDDIPILVFDEIDANIGGRTAAAVAAELTAVGQRHQVFSITHLPLIAAAGRQHFLVEKRIDGDRTVTTMAPLSRKQRVAELVRMLGAAPDDQAAIAHAREMLETATD